MPAPNPQYHALYNYLKKNFPYKEDLTLDGETFPFAKVKEAVYSLKDCNPELLRVLNLYIFQALSRSRIAEEIGADPSTIRRSMDRCLQLVLCKLRFSDLFPDDLFQIRTVIPSDQEEKFEKVVDPKTGVTEYRKLPVPPPTIKIEYSKYPKINFRLD